LELNHSVLVWNFEDKNNQRTLYSAEKHFHVKGHTINKQMSMAGYQNTRKF